MADICTSCADARRAQQTAERMTSRLLAMLALAEAREAGRRDEIGHLEARAARHIPTWQTEAVSLG